MFETTMLQSDLMFDIPLFTAPAAIRPLPFCGEPPRSLYAGKNQILRHRKWHIKQLLIPILRRTGYTGNMEQTEDTLLTAASCLPPENVKNEKRRKDMFDTMKVARKIREARIARNMTQMNLADAMEVSYQAVSNWERGSSCPDIGKLEQLSQVLEISVEELLGTDSAARTLSRIMDKEEASAEEAEPITMEQIQEVAPLLPPADMERLVDDSLDGQDETESLDLKAIIGLAPFLDEKYLDSLIKRAHVQSLKELAGLAPFLSEEALDALVEKADIEKDISGIIGLAPFLRKETLDGLVSRMLPLDDWRGLTGLAPFLSRETLDALVESVEKKEDMAHIAGLAPFLSSKTLDRLARRMLSLDDWQGITGLAPFLSKDTLSAMVEDADPQKDMTHIASLAPFLGEKALKGFLQKLPDDAHVDISGLFPFLSQETLQGMAETLMRGGNLRGLKAIAPFL